MLRAKEEGEAKLISNRPRRQPEQLLPIVRARRVGAHAVGVQAFLQPSKGAVAKSETSKQVLSDKREAPIKHYEQQQLLTFSERARVNATNLATKKPESADAADPERGQTEPT